MTSDRDRAMATVLDYLADAADLDDSVLALLRLRAAEADTTEIDAWIRQQRSTGDTPDQKTSDQ